MEGLSELGGLWELDASRPTRRSNCTTLSASTATWERSSATSVSLAASSVWCLLAWVSITVWSWVITARWHTSAARSSPIDQVVTSSGAGSDMRDIIGTRALRVNSGRACQPADGHHGHVHPR